MARSATKSREVLWISMFEQLKFQFLQLVCGFQGRVDADYTWILQVKSGYVLVPFPFDTFWIFHHVPWIDTQNEPSDHQPHVTLRSEIPLSGPKWWNHLRMKTFALACLITHGLSLMWVKHGITIINNPPNHHRYCSWYTHHSQSWVAYGIVLPTLDNHHSSLLIIMHHYYKPSLTIINQYYHYIITINHY